MGRQIERLTAKQVATLGAGLHRDGDGLLLKVEPSGARRWLLRLAVGGGKRREMGLGSASTVTLTEARAKAAEIRAQVRSGIDPVSERRAQREAADAGGTTFADAAESFLIHKLATLTNSKHKAQWISTLDTYVLPFIGDRPVSEVQTSEIIDILAPIWHEKAETARRVLQRLEAIFETSIALGHRTAASPCVGVKRILGRSQDRPENWRALPWREVPKLVAALRADAHRGVITRRCLEFTILTASRSGEVRGARWDEFDLGEKLWTVPDYRMKARREHRVPLSDRACEIAGDAAISATVGDFVFGGDSGGLLSDMTLTKWLRDHQWSELTTVHGLRASFRTWCADSGVRHEVAEACLAHAAGSKVVAAYQRSDFLAERVDIMQRWSDFCGGVPENTNAISST